MCLQLNACASGFFFLKQNSSFVIIVVVVFFLIKKASKTSNISCIISCHNFFYNSVLHKLATKKKSSDSSQ